MIDNNDLNNETIDDLESNGNEVDTKPVQEEFTGETKSSSSSNKLFTNVGKRKIMILFLLLLVPILIIFNIFHVKDIKVIIDGNVRSYKTRAIITDSVIDDISKEFSLSEFVESNKSGAFIEDQDIIYINTKKTIPVTLKGEVTELVTFENTVQELLDENSHLIEKDNKNSSFVVSNLESDYATTSLKEVEQLVIDVKYTEVEEKTEKIKFKTIYEDDNTLFEGTTKLKTDGVNGSELYRYETIYINGKKDKVNKEKIKVVSAPVDKVVLKGTKKPIVTQPVKATNEIWDQMAKCESGGNWSTNTGNGYYGGLQFTAATWAAAGGTKYSSLPHLATREEQIAIADSWLARTSWGQWPGCSSKLGLR